MSLLLRSMKIAILSAGIHKCLEESLLRGRAESHNLRMPLHRQAEGIAVQLKRFGEAFGAVCGDPESLSRFLYRLMVEAVHGSRIGIEQVSEEPFRIQIDGMRGS